MTCRFASPVLAAGQLQALMAFADTCMNVLAEEYVGTTPSPDSG